MYLYGTFWKYVNACLVSELKKSFVPELILTISNHWGGLAERWVVDAEKSICIYNFM